MDNWNEFDDTSWQIAFCIIQLVCYVDILEENSKQDMIYREKAFFFFFYYLSSSIAQYTQANFQVRMTLSKLFPFLQTISVVLSVSSWKPFLSSYITIVDNHSTTAATEERLAKDAND